MHVKARSSQGAPRLPGDSPRDIVRAYFAALEGGRFDDVPYAEDATFRAPLTGGGTGEPLNGRKAILEFLEAVATRIDRVGVHAVLVDGPWAAGAATLTLSSPPQAEIRTMNLFQIEAGQIVDQENYFDPRSALGL